MHHETFGVNYSVSCYRLYTVQFGVTSVPDFGEICGTTMNFVFFVWVTLTKIVNTCTPLGRSAALVLSAYRCTVYSVSQKKNPPP